MSEENGISFEQRGETYAADIRNFMRNNITETAQLLKPILVGRTFIRNTTFTLTKHKKFQEGVVYYTARQYSNRATKYYPVSVEVGAPVLADTYYQRNEVKEEIGGYPKITLPRGYGVEVSDNAFDSRWDDGVGMYRLPDCADYPYITGYTVFAMPLVLKALADWLVKMHWRLHVFIDAALSTLIDKFVITVEPESAVVEDNKVYNIYTQTSDVTFQEGKTYYIRLESGGFSEASVPIGAHVRTQTGYTPTTDTQWQEGVDYYVRVRNPDILAQYSYYPLTTIVIGANIVDTDNPRRPGYKLRLDEVFVPFYNGFNDYYEKESIGYADYVKRIKEDDSTTPETNRYYVPVANNRLIVADQDYYYYDAKTNDYVKCTVLPYSNDIEYYLKGERVRHYAKVPEGTVLSPDVEYYNAARKKLTNGVDYVAGEIVTSYDDFYVIADGQWDGYEGFYLTADTKFKTNKLYFTRSSEPNENGIYVYTEFVSPTASSIPANTYYEYFDWYREQFKLVSHKDPAFFDGKAIYRWDGTEYVCVGNGHGMSTLFVGKTKHMNVDGHAVLFTPLQAGASTTLSTGQKLYVDPENEDIARVKNVINLFARCYLTVLSVRGRSYTSIGPIPGDARYTTADLLERLNTIIENINQYNTGTPILRMDYVSAADTTFNPEETYYVRGSFNVFRMITDNSLIVRVNGKIAEAAAQSRLGNNEIYKEAGTYTVRDMKLKANEIIDFILKEAFYLRATDADSDFYLGNLESEFWKFWPEGDVLYKMATDANYISDNRIYNDRWFFYDPALPYVRDTLKILDYTECLTESTREAIPGRIYREDVKAETAHTPGQFGGYFVYVDDKVGFQPLCRVANVYNMADNWSKCDYAGCMQIITLTKNMLNSKTTEFRPWDLAVTDAAVDVTPEQQAILDSIKTQIDTLRGRLDLFGKFAPHVAAVMADIAYHVTNVFKIHLRGTVPDMVEVTQDTFVPDTVYYRFNSGTNRYEGVGVIAGADAFATRLNQYGRLFKAVF